MKLNGSMLIVVAMMAGSLGALGCKSNDSSTSPATGSDTSAAASTAVAPEETPETAPTEAAANAGVEKDSLGFRFYAPLAPPSVRIEERGAARPGHFWAPGYYRWNGHSHVWAPGGWYAERPGYTWVAPRWAAEGPRYRYYRGYWRR